MRQGTGGASARTPGRPAWVGLKSESSLVWQPTDRTLWGTGARAGGLRLPSSWGFPPALWTPEEGEAPANGPRQEGLGRLGWRGELAEV